MQNKKHIKRIDEDFMMSDPTKAPVKTPTPTKTPTRRSPSPIRRDKPSIKPKPMASADEVYDRFITELRDADGKIEFDLKYLAAKYKMEESQIVKGFAQYVYEASLEDNPGIPGEGEGDDSDKYLRGIEGRANQMKHDTKQRYGHKIPQFMQTVQAVQRLQSGKERELEALAEDAIREMYGSILDGVKLDIKFPVQNELKDEMEDVEMESPTPQEEIEDENVRKEIYKRKIANNITQGEAKNTKLILNMPFIADGLRDIFGEEDGSKMIELLTEITNIASFFDWEIPIEIQKQMWQNKSGFAGTVSVDWEESKDEDTEKTAEDIIASLESGDDILDNSDELEELFNETTPTIKARGLDFAMLIHETVKGIYQLISAMGIPEDESIANLVIMNTDTLAGELEDLRYGPYIAQDLHRFISEFPESNDIDNLKEHFFGKMMQLPADEFLELIRLILMGDDRAKRMSQDIIDDISSEIRDFEVDSISSYGDDSDDDFEIDSYGKPSASPLTGDGNYSAMSNREIQELIDDALDNGDIDEVKRLAKYLKESLRIQLEHKLNESKYSHIVSFNTFKKKVDTALNESISNGKNYFIKLKAESAGFNHADLTDDERKRIETDPDWIKIRQIIERSKRDGDAVAFVKFYINQGASFDRLNDLADDLADQQVKSIINDLPMTLAEYANLETDGPNGTPGYEKLLDDIATAKSTLVGRWVVKKLSTIAGTKDYMGNNIEGAQPFNQKEAFRSLSNEDQNEILRLASQLKAMDKDGKVIASFTKRISRIRSMDELKRELGNRIAGFDTNMNSALEQIDKLGSAASLVWQGRNKAIFIFRSPYALNQICSIAEWCINPRQGGSSSFYDYATGGNIQYVMFDYNKPVSHNNHIIGVTVKPDGSIRAAHDRSNNSMTNFGHRAGQGNPTLDGNFRAFLDYFEIPQEDKEIILDAVPEESRTMSELGPIFQSLQQGGNNLDKIINDMIISTERRARDASFKGENYKKDRADQLRDSIIANEISNDTDVNRERAKNNILDRFKTKGCTNIESAKHFKTIFKEDIPSNIIDNIITATNRRKDGLNQLLKTIARANNLEKAAIERNAGRPVSQLKEDSNIMIDNLESSIAYLTSLKK